MSYDPSHPTVYFDIGEAVAAIGILLAFISLASPPRKLRWGLGSFRLRTAYGLFSFGFVCVLVAAVLPSTRLQVVGVGGLPVFWEVFGGLCLGLGSAGLIWSSRRPVKFRPRNARLFAQVSYDWLARGDIQELAALGQEISASVGEIVEACARYNRFDAAAASKEGRKYIVSATTRLACELMQLWSDRRFCNTLVTRCPKTAVAFLLEIQRKKLYDSCADPFVEQVIAEAFRDKESILYREEEFSGLGHVLAFTETVFDNYEFVESNFRPLQAVRVLDGNLAFLEKYIECLVRAVRSYLEAGAYRGHGAAIECGIRNLASSAHGYVAALDEAGAPGRVEDSPEWALRKISQGFVQIITHVSRYEQKIPTHPLVDSEVRQEKDYSIHAIVARGIYEFLDALTRAKGGDRKCRDAAMDVWLEVYSPSPGSESTTVVEIQKRLEISLWEQVRKNLEERLFYYPLITRLVINVVGLHDGTRGSDGWNRVVDRLRSTIRVGFRKTTELHEGRAVELLPEGYVYDGKENVIRIQSRWGGGEETFRCK